MNQMSLKRNFQITKDTIFIFELPRTLSSLINKDIINSAVLEHSPTKEAKADVVLESSLISESNC